MNMDDRGFAFYSLLDGVKSLVLQSTFYSIEFGRHRSGSVC
jgi:hypothetical protein